MTVVLPGPPVLPGSAAPSGPPVLPGLPVLSGPAVARPGGAVWSGGAAMTGGAARLGGAARTGGPARLGLRWAGALLAAGLLLLVSGCGAGADGGQPTHPPADSTSSAPWFPTCPRPTGPAHGDHTLPALGLPCAAGGRTVRLDRAFDRPTVINLWASWCAPCRAELPEVQRYATAHPQVLVLTVDTHDTRTAGESFARDAGVRLPTLTDPDRRLLTGVGRSALPVTLLVTADGRLVETYNGAPLTAHRLGTLVDRYLR